VIDHLAIQCADVAAGVAFHDAVLEPLGGRVGPEYHPPG
jgi:hypothetical protein